MIQLIWLSFGTKKPNKLNNRFMLNIRENELLVALDIVDVRKKELIIQSIKKLILDLKL